MHAEVYLSDRLTRRAFDFIEDNERVPVAADERSLHNWVATPKGRNRAKRESRPVNNLVIVFALALPHVHQIGTSKNTSVRRYYPRRGNLRPYGANFWVEAFLPKRREIDNLFTIYYIVI